MRKIHHLHTEVKKKNRNKNIHRIYLRNLKIQNDEVEKDRHRLTVKLKTTKEKLKHLQTAYKPRNVKRREETKQRCMSQLEERLDRKSKEVKELKEELLTKQTEKILLQNKQKEIANKFEHQIESEKPLKVRAQKQASKWKRKEYTVVREENKMMQILNVEVHYLENENEKKKKIEEILNGKAARTFQGGRYSDVVWELCYELVARRV